MARTVRVDAAAVGCSPSEARGGSLADGLAQRLATAVRTPVEYGRPFSQVSMGKTGLTAEQLAFVEPLSAVPVGLAMGAV